jgi:hypothetical protein
VQLQNPQNTPEFSGYGNPKSVVLIRNASDKPASGGRRLRHGIVAAAPAGYIQSPKPRFFLIWSDE